MTAAAKQLSPAAQWAALVALTVTVTGALLWGGAPAAYMLGPMAAGIVLGTSGGRIAIPLNAFSLAQGVVGCMVARMLGTLLNDPAPSGNWLLFALGGVWVIAGSALLGWLLIRSRILPGTTILWGLSPGAATTMTLMAEAYGADAQLVAFMQYIRVVVVVALAACVARLYGVSAHAVVSSAVWLRPIDWPAFAETLALAVGGALIAIRFDMRAGALLIPAGVGLLLTRFGWMKIELPQWLLVISYGTIGWRIGLRFTRPLLKYAVRTLPRVMLSTLALIALCAGLGVMLTVFAGIDPLTSYLATSPGGADTAAIIAASSNVNVHFVMGMQMTRLIGVMLLAPPLTRFVAARATVQG